MKEKWVENDFEVKVEQISNCQSRGGGAHIISLSSDFKLASTVQIQWSGVQSKYSEIQFKCRETKYLQFSTTKSNSYSTQQEQAMRAWAKYWCLIHNSSNSSILCNACMQYMVDRIPNLLKYHIFSEAIASLAPILWSVTTPQLVNNPG